MSESLRDEIRACVGRSQSPVMELVTRRDIRKYAVATRQSQKKYLDGTEAPPRFHTALLADLVPLDELDSNGRARDPLLALLPFESVGVGRVMTRYFQPIRCGDYLVAQRKITALHEKEGAGGSRYVCEITLVVENDYGAPLLIETSEHLLR